MTTPRPDRPAPEPHWAELPGWPAPNVLERTGEPRVTRTGRTMTRCPHLDTDPRANLPGLLLFADVTAAFTVPSTLTLCADCAQAMLAFVVNLFPPSSSGTPS